MVVTEDVDNRGINELVGGGATRDRSSGTNDGSNKQDGVKSTASNSNTSGSSSSSTSNAEGLKGRNGAPVTAEDLALREDICYQIFGDVGALVRDFSCAWDHKVVMHGRMYVTERRLCFYANFFGLEAKMSLRHEDVARCSKGNSAIFIPNVIVVQDKSGKDFVFRNFWDRDECHSLLERLRLVAVEEEEKMAKEAAARAASVLSWDGEQLHRGSFDNGPGSNEQKGGNDQQGVLIPFPSPERTTEGARPAARRDGSGRRLPLESTARRRPLSPPTQGECRPSSVPPPRRTHSGTMPSVSVPSSLPCSPNPSVQRARPAAVRKSSASSASSGDSIAVAASEARPSKLGLAVVGAEHEAPSPPRVSPSLGDRHKLRPSPVVTSVITGAGRGGWGAVDPQFASGGHVVSPLRGPRYVDGRLAGNGATTNGKSTPAKVGMQDARGGGRHRRARSDIGGSEGGGRSATGRGDVGGDPVAGAVAAVTANGSKEGGEGTGAKVNGVGVRAGGLVRQGSRLWKMMRWNGEEGGGQEDPKADRKAMEAAIQGEGNHAEVATADFDVAVKEFYEAFFGDDAPYGLPDFHMSRGDWEVDAGDWQQTTEEDGGGDGNPGRWAGGGSGGVTRAIRFKTPLHITFMSSPGQVRTLKRQRARFFGSQGCIVDTITTVEDRIPLSDNFHVEDRWVIRPRGKDGSSCTVTVTWRCVWHKFTVIKGFIEGKCRADVKSFNIAFLEGMNEHLVSKRSPASLKRCPSLKATILSAGRRASRERSISARSRLSSFERPEDDLRSSGSSFNSEDGRGIKAGGLLDRCLPAIRVFSMCFILYISVFWVRHQMLGGLSGSALGMAAGRGGGTAGPGAGASKEDIMVLYGEWGRSSLALLDVRAETRRLSSEILQLGRARDSESRGNRVASDWTREDEQTVQQLLQEMEKKVTALSQRTDDALETLNSTASQIRDASACPAVRDIGGPCEQGCAQNVAA